MNIKHFIDRPILSFVISVAILFVGLIGLYMLPIEQFPEIAPPSISVEAYYTGANAETVQKSVIAPLEESINGVENMMYMTSSATNNGSAEITIYFKQGTDADMAMVNVQNRIASAQGLLPAEVTRSGVNVDKRLSSNIKVLALYSPDNSYDADFINNYMMINIEPQISRISGVGDMMVLGAKYSLRIWLDPQKMASYSLIPSDVTAALSQQNLESPTGTIGAESNNTFQYVLKYEGRFENEKDYENIVIRSLSDGEVLRLKDIADVEIGLETYSFASNVSGGTGVIAMVSQTAGSNANEIIENIDKLSVEIRKDLPKGLEFVDIMSTKDYLDASIDNVIITLIEAILLVILVVYVFLQSFRSSLIPAISIVVSLVGTFALIYAIGFTLNMLTLFALVLVIGTVVDDAIVVVEAVQAKFDAGYKSSYHATVDAMKGISGALVTTTVVFMAVFIPVSFMGGTTGTFYTQFGLTMAIAVGISTINALTLSPALSALLMTPHQTEGSGEKLSFSSRFHIAFERSFSSITAKYKAIVIRFIKHKWITWMLLIVTFGGIYYLATTTKTAMVPDEDMGTVFVNVSTPPGSTLEQTQKTLDAVEEAVKSIPEIEIYTSVSGFGLIGGQGASNGMFIIRLKDWSERDYAGGDIKSVIGKIYGLTSHIKSGMIMAIAPPMITGYGANNGFEVHVQDRAGGTVNDLFMNTQKFMGALRARPEIAQAFSTFNPMYPQYLVEVDAAVCMRNGVMPAEVLATLSGYVGGNYVSNMNKFSRLYRVMIQAPTEDRIDMKSLDNIFVRNSNGEMSPITQYITLTQTYGADNLTRFNMFNSISLSGTPAEGYSSGQAIEAIQEVASQVLPMGYGVEFGGLTREEASTGSSQLVIFIICLIFVYLILCALYESVFIPLAVITSVPFGVLGSFLFAKMFGITNDIYMQTALIMIIGLLAKTAILLTEFASERRASGMSITAAAVSAAETRLRPILMTSLTMVIGMLPLAVAQGVGANGNISLGVAIIGGMIVGTLALVFIVPILFIVFQNIQERVMPKRVITDEK